MIVYPAMDLLDGRCVRLTQGRFDEVTTYSADPAEALAAFADAGATWAHVVDLDGARGGAPVQHDLIASLARVSTLSLQVAGGFRTRDEVARMMEAGAARVAIGSLAVKEPAVVRALLDEFGGDRLALALDVHVVGGVPMVAFGGWTEISGQSLHDVAALYSEARHIIVTDISRDGTLLGPNFRLVEEVSRRSTSLCVQASGGVASPEDLRALKQAGAAGAIVGKALWEGVVDLAEAIQIAGR